jgi:nucleoside-diphosphate-sugar epimerase
MRPVVITGISGFVGRHVAQALIGLGIPVRGLVRDRGRLAGTLSRSVELFEGDLASSRVLGAMTQGAAAVVHCAGAIRAKSRDEFFAINAKGTERLVEAAEASGVERFVHVSSIAAREAHLSHYAASKKESETAVEKTARRVSWIIVRPPVVYGPGDRSTLSLIAALTRRSAWLPGTADARFSLLHVGDLAHALAMLSIIAQPSAANYEIDDGRPGGYGWPDVEAAAAAVNGWPIRVVLIPKALLVLPVLAAGIATPFTARAPLLSPGKLNELYHADWVVRGPRLDAVCGWRPQQTFETGLEDTVAWYREHGWIGQPAGGRPSKAAHRAGVARS